MSVTQTSLDAYWSLEKPKVSRQQQMVLDALERMGPLCDKQLVEVTGLPLNVINPRRGELVKKGLIEKESETHFIGGRRVIFWQPRSGYAA